MNPAIFEIYDFFTSAELTFNFSGSEDKNQFMFDYCVKNKHVKLDAAALHVFNQDFNTKNIRAFSKTYLDSMKRYQDLMLGRYLISTLPPDSYREALLLKLAKYKLQVIQECPVEHLNTPRYRKSGAIHLKEMPDDSPCGMKFEIAYVFPAPTPYYVFREVIESFGLLAQWPRYKANQITSTTVEMSMNRQQEQAIKIGKALAEKHHPQKVL